MTSRVDAILFRTANPARLAAFYREGFALAPGGMDTDAHTGLRAANTYFGFDLAPDDETAGGRGAVSVWFTVDDAAATYARLIGLGALDMMEPDAECSPGEILAQVRDPDGNVVGLIQKTGDDA
ncbi:MAG: VOC family protein [Planctomycetota bacterium]